MTYSNSTKAIKVVVMDVASLEASENATYVGAANGTSTWAIASAPTGTVTVEAFPMPYLELTTNIAAAVAPFGSDLVILILNNVPCSLVCGKVRSFGFKS